MAELRMLSAGPADMREVGLDARAHSGSPAAEACRRESHAPVVSGRIERCDRHVACALRRGQQAIVPGIHEIRERCGGVRGPFRTKVLWRDVACGNEYDGVVCFGDLIEPRGLLAVSLDRKSVV